MPESGLCFLSDASQDGHPCLRLCSLVLGCGEKFPVSLSSHLLITLRVFLLIRSYFSPCKHPNMDLTPCAWHSAKDVCYQPDDNLMNP